MSTKKKSRVAPKVTLTLSPEQDVLFCTSSEMSKISAQVTCYQNTSDPANPRVTSQRMLVTDCGGVQSIGKSWETMGHGARYMVGVLDKETNEMQLHPGTLINLKPYITSFEDQDQEPLSKPNIRYGERYKDLAMTFGDSRIQKTLRGKDKTRDMETNTLEEAMVEAVRSAEPGSLTSSTPLTPHHHILPPINIHATQLQDVFLLTDLISLPELEALAPFTRVLGECTQLHVQTWTSQNKYPEYVLSHLPVTMADPHQTHLYLAQLLYISYLITLLKLQRKYLKNRKSNFPNTPSIVVENIYMRFTSQGLIEGRQRSSISETQRHQLLSHILALTLITDNYCVPIDVICKDTAVKLDTLCQSYKSMGCTVTNVKGADRVAVLKLPVKLPDVVLKRGRKKRV